MEIDKNKVYYSVEGFPYKIEAVVRGVIYVSAYEQGFMKRARIREILDGSFSIFIKGKGYVKADTFEEFYELKKSHAYFCWNQILGRIGTGCWHDVTISNEWKDFLKFKEFHDKWWKNGFAIDKDLLADGRRIYSAETCTFMPLGLNSTIREMTSFSLKFRRIGKKYAFNISQSGYSQTIMGNTLNETIHLYAIYRCSRVLTMLEIYIKDLRKEAVNKIISFYNVKAYEKWIKEHLKEDNPPLNDSHINRFTPKKTS